MPRNTSEQQPLDPVIRKGDYVEIANTTDEWEGIIGVVEEFYTEIGDFCKFNDPGVFFAQIRIPTRKSDQRPLRLWGVNHLTGYVLYELRNNDDIKLVKVSCLEYVDEEEL